MRTKKHLLLLLGAVFLLAGCKGNSSSSGSEISSSESEVTTNGNNTSAGSSSGTGGNGGGASSEKTTSFPVGDFEETDNWPTLAINSYLKSLGITDRTPNVDLPRETYHSVQVDEYGEHYYLEIYTDDENDLSIIEEAFANADYYIESESDSVFAVSPHDEVGMEAYFYPEDEENDAAILVYIYAYEEDENGGGDSDGNPLEDYVKHTSWPTTAISAFLADYGLTYTIPSLSGVTEVYTDVFEGDENYWPYIELFVPTTDRVSAYLALFTGSAWDVYEDEDYEDYYYADNETLGLYLYVFYEAEGGGYPAGMSIIIFVDDEQNPYIGTGNNGDGGNGGGDVNPNQTLTFNFANESQLTTKNDDKSIWTVSGSTMTIEKNGSPQKVGNNSYYSKPLRIYFNQKVTFDGGTGKTISQIVITISEFEKDKVIKYGEGVANATFEPAATVNATSTTVTITPKSSVQKITFVASEQVRFASLVIYYN